MQFTHSATKQFDKVDDIILLCSTVTDQIAFDKRDLNLIPSFEPAMDRCSQVLASKLKISDTITIN